MTVDDGYEDPLALAESAYELVDADADAAAALAQRALRLARARREAEAEVAALHALGFAWHELGDPRALRATRAAVRVGDRRGLTRRAAFARRRLALDLAGRGAVGPALRELDTACASLDAHELARSEVFRIAVLLLAGNATEPLAGTDQALATLRRKGDAIWEARLLRNRGLLLAERGHADAAEPDLIRARDLYAVVGARAAVLAIEMQLARIALMRGDLPACLACLDAIDAGSVSAVYAAELELLRAQALAAARLMSEARQSLTVAQAIWQRAGKDDHEGRFEAIRLALLAGDPAGGLSVARRAQRSFAAQQRHLYAARAGGLALAATIAAGSIRPSALRSGRRAAATLAAAGWREEALCVRLSVARAAIELGAPGVARRELAACAALRRRGRVADRIEAWHVEALLRLGSGDLAGAQRAARSGLRLLEGYRAALGASDLRASASEIGIGLAELGLRIALDGGDTSSTLTWAERLRGSALRLSPVMPPDNPELRDRETDLRQCSAEIQREHQAGRSARALMARRAALELSIRRLSRHAAGTSGAATSTPGRRELAGALGTAALVELIELDEELTALTLVAGRLRRHRLGPVAAVKEDLEWLRFALARLAHGHRSPAQRAAVLAGARGSADALDQRLIGPLAETLEDRPLVIVPTGSLHGLPWAMLPSLRARPLVIAPSAASWLALQARPCRRRRKVVLVAGPRLRHATAELAAVGGLYPDADVLTGKQADVASVMRALSGASVAHLACHGHFRADSPLFSSLELADGPLNVYELQRLPRAPALIVLSACDLAVSDTRPGDELLGFAAALIGMGARTIIASVVPVPDAAAKPMMIALHRDLTAGRSPAVALARAQQALRDGESALAGFVCLGSDGC